MDWEPRKGACKRITELDPKTGERGRAPGAIRPRGDAAIKSLIHKPTPGRTSTAGESSFRTMGLDGSVLRWWTVKPWLARWDFAWTSLLDRVPTPLPALRTAASEARTRSDRYGVVRTGAVD